MADCFRRLTQTQRARCNPENTITPKALRVNVGWGDATHYLHCAHCIGRSVKHYKMRCAVLGKTKTGKVKIVVFGERYWAGRSDKRRVRYVEEYRLSMMSSNVIT